MNVSSAAISNAEGSISRPGSAPMVISLRALSIPAGATNTAWERRSKMK
jgi:hypothetical protein